MAAEGVWHGTKKCAVNGAKLPRAKQVPGQRCPFCGNTVGAYIGTSSTPSASSTEQQIANLQRLLDDGLITDEEYAERRETLLDEAVATPTPQPRQVLRPPAASSSTQFGKSLYDDRGGPTDAKQRINPKIIVGAVLGVLLLVLLFVALDDNGGSSSGSDGLTPAEQATVNRIESLTDCDALQREFDIAYDNRGEPLTDRHRRSQIYMDTADDRMRSLGCYD